MPVVKTSTAAERIENPLRASQWRARRWLVVFIAMALLAGVLIYYAQWARRPTAYLLVCFAAMLTTMAIPGAMVCLHRLQQARRQLVDAERLLSGEGVLAHWVCAGRMWHSRKLRHASRWQTWVWIILRCNTLTAMGFSACGVMIAIETNEHFEPLWWISIGSLLGASVAGLVITEAYGIHATHRRRWRNRDVVIGSAGMLMGGRYLSFADKPGLAAVVLDRSEPAVLTFRWRGTRAGRSGRVVHIPVPEDHLAAAAQAAAGLAGPIGKIQIEAAESLA